MPTQIYNFFELSAAFDLPPEQAVAYFQGKVLKTSFHWQAMAAEEHAVAFTVAKMMDTDLLAFVQGEAQRAIDGGGTLAAFRNTLIPRLQKAGWWGKKDVVDPATGKVVAAQLGSASRLAVIFRTNLHSAYAVGQWQGINANKQSAPYLMYDAVDDHRVRPAHQQWHGVVRPVDDNLWKTHFPPNGWNCRCGVIQLSADELKQAGLTVAKPPTIKKRKWTNPLTNKGYLIPEGIEPGWDYNPGQRRVAHLAQLKKDKERRLSTAQQTAITVSDQAVDKHQQALLTERAANNALKALGEAAVEGTFIRQQQKARQRAKDYQAQAALEDIQQHPKGQTLKHQILQKLEKNGEAASLSPTQLLQQVQTQYTVAQGKKEMAAKLSGYKKKVLAGQLPTPAQMAVFNKLDDAAKHAFLTKLDKAKQQSGVSIPSTAPVWQNLIKTGHQKGSNPGGVYQDQTTGKRYYIKEPGSDDNGRNEVLAARLYQAAGVEVPNVWLLNDGTTVRVASEIIDDLKQSQSTLTSGKIQGIHDSFMVDAWLANWDVVGLQFDNLLIKGNRAIRIDTGGALRYRAQGGQKGAAFGKDVLEINSLRDAPINPQAAAVFASVSHDALVAGARKVLALDKQAISDLIEQFGPTTKKARKSLLLTLLARQRFIAKQFPEALNNVTPETIPTSAITRLEHEQIVNSRSNGYTIATDKGEIEDQNVLLYHKQNLAGEAVTAAYFKVRPDTMRKLERAIQKQLQAHEGYNDFHGLLVKAVRSVAHRAAIGSGMEDYVFERIKSALERHREVLSALKLEVHKKQRPKSDLEDFKTRTKAFVAQLQIIADSTVEGEIPKWNSMAGFYTAFEIPLPETANRDSPIRWKKAKTTFRLSSFERGHQRERDGTYTLASHHYEATVNNAVVRYWPQEDGTYFALQGRVEIEVPGQQQHDSLRVFNTIEQLGVNSQRASPQAMEEMFLDKLAYIHKQEKAVAKATADAESAPQRIERKRVALAKKLKLDLENSASYNPAGEYQAFNQGRRLFYRPELLDNDDFSTLAEQQRLHHKNTSSQPMTELLKAVLEAGGQMAPTSDKIRRGIKPGGMSPEADLQSGGGNYFFTRIKGKEAAYHEPGFVWKARPLARMDAISYASDHYGRTTGDHVQKHRKVTVSQLRTAAKASRNETIFKDSLSVFDDLDRIVANTADERDNIIEVIRKAGYQQWPDGRALEDVVRVKGKS